MNSREKKAVRFLGIMLIILSIFNLIVPPDIDSSDQSYSGKGGVFLLLNLMLNYLFGNIGAFFSLLCLGVCIIIFTLKKWKPPYI